MEQLPLTFVQATVEPDIQECFRPAFNFTKLSSSSGRLAFTPGKDLQTSRISRRYSDILLVSFPENDFSRFSVMLQRIRKAWQKTSNY